VEIKLVVGHLAALGVPKIE